ncbi:chromosome segregation protein [Carpediemonas membranifera]|uniref:Chromosome segregation protein n=1 Tax=Carpediemonas membranifera TaxID=201153 RepID=A0A8J6AYW2_9EUKA|nr:chromosome segregation protein [Carpediemonas membranifera]|eukprot:KAG9395750.1 chromosome segregation protein [Carpediemonas membranifera]
MEETFIQGDTSQYSLSTLDESMAGNETMLMGDETMTYTLTDPISKPSLYTNPLPQDEDINSALAMSIDKRTGGSGAKLKAKELFDEFRTMDTSIPVLASLDQLNEWMTATKNGPKSALRGASTPSLTPPGMNNTTRDFYRREFGEKVLREERKKLAADVAELIEKFNCEPQPTSNRRRAPKAVRDPANREWASNRAAFLKKIQKAKAEADSKAESFYFELCGGLTSAMESQFSKEAKARYCQWFESLDKAVREKLGKESKGRYDEFKEDAEIDSDVNRTPWFVQQKLDEVQDLQSTRVAQDRELETRKAVALAHQHVEMNEGADRMKSVIDQLSTQLAADSELSSDHNSQIEALEEGIKKIEAEIASKNEEIKKVSMLASIAEAKRAAQASSKGTPVDISAWVWKETGAATMFMGMFRQDEAGLTLHPGLTEVEQESSPFPGLVRRPWCVGDGVRAYFRRLQAIVLESMEAPADPVEADQRFGHIFDHIMDVVSLANCPKASLKRSGAKFPRVAQVFLTETWPAADPTSLKISLQLTQPDEPAVLFVLSVPIADLLSSLRQRNPEFVFSEDSLEAGQVPVRVLIGNPGLRRYAGTGQYSSLSELAAGLARQQAGIMDEVVWVHER